MRGSEIGPEQKTLLITVQDAAGMLPGQRSEYLEYLLTEKLAGDRYLTKLVKAKQKETCPLCGTKNISILNAKRSRN